MIQDIERNRRENSEEPSFVKGIEPMTRAEWVKKAREECGKELEYYDMLRKRAEEIWEEEQGEEAKEEQEEITDGVEQCEEEPELEAMNVEEEEQEEEHIELKKLYSPSFEWSYLSKFTVRLIAAVVIALFVITVDYFGIKQSVFNSDTIRTAIQKNDTIESVEDSVTTFAKEKVMPIFQKK